MFCTSPDVVAVPVPVLEAAATAERAGGHLRRALAVRHAVPDVLLVRRLGLELLAVADGAGHGRHGGGRCGGAMMSRGAAAEMGERWKGPAGRAAQLIAGHRAVTHLAVTAP